MVDGANLQVGRIDELIDRIVRLLRPLGADGLVIKLSPDGVWIIKLEHGLDSKIWVAKSPGLSSVELANALKEVAQDTEEELRLKQIEGKDAKD